MTTQTIHIDLPGGASATITYLPPDPPPTDGADWPTELDWPGVTAMLRLPAVVARRPQYGERMVLAPELRSSRRLWGHPMDGDWGQAAGGAVCMWTYCRRATMDEAEAVARSEIAAAGVVLAQVAGARAARLRQREATIASSHEGSGWPL